MIGNFPAVLNFNRLFLKLNRFICNLLPVLPDHRSYQLEMATCWHLLVSVYSIEV